MAEIEFFDPDHFPAKDPVIVILGARFDKKWLFVKNRDRNGYELPAGHIDDNEFPYDAARRELNEETGAEIFNLECVATYSVTEKGISEWGKLYFAEIIEMGPRLDGDEIEDVLMSDKIPGRLNYHEIQSVLFNYLQMYLKEKRT